LPTKNKETAKCPTKAPVFNGANFHAFFIKHTQSCVEISRILSARQSRPRTGISFNNRFDEDTSKNENREGRSRAKKIPRRLNRDAIPRADHWRHLSFACGSGEISAKECNRIRPVPRLAR
jgi:hypothetical protein